MKKDLIQEVAIVGSIIVLAVFAGLSQTIVYWFKTPPDVVFSFAHNYLEDYFYYLHIMRQGFDGFWLATSRMTPEVFPGQFVNTWLLFLGHLARIANISLPVMYTLSRVGGAVAILILSYKMIQIIYKDFSQRIIALLFVAFGTFFWIPRNHGIEIPWLVRAWTELDPLFRLSYIPHHLWSKVFFMVLLLMVITPWNRYKLLQIIFVAVLTLVMGFSSPIIIAIFVPLILLYTLFDALIVKKKFFKNFHQHTLIGVAVIVSVLVGYHHRLVQYSVFPWTGSYIAWENFMRYPITLKAFIETLGPTIIFFIFAIPQLLKESRVTRLLVAWAITGFALLFIVGNIVPLSNSRYLAGYYFIPMAIGAVSGVYMLAKKISIFMHRPTRQVVQIIVICLSMYFSIGLFVTWKLHAIYIRENSANTQVYLPNDVIGALDYLQTQQSGVILGRYWVSTMIPAYTSHRSVAGHMLMTLNNDEKMGEIAQFYSYTLHPSQTIELMKKYNVMFILEDQVNAVSNSYMKLLSLEAVYSNKSVTIYKRISQ